MSSVPAADVPKMKDAAMSALGRFLQPVGDRGLRGRGAAAMLVAALLLALAASGGCRRAGSDREAPASKGKEVELSGDLMLKPEQIEKAGVRTAPAAAARQAPEASGYAVVLTRDTLAQALAEVNAAAAAERQSRAALARDRRLAGTPGAMPIETQEGAERQATVDHSALMLAERRLAASYGPNAPWKDNYHSRELTSLASGDTKLARVTFPLGALESVSPTRLKFTRMSDYQTGKSFDSATVWNAPADANLPGRSFFAILKGNDASEGERLLARAATGEPEAGVVVPFSAVVISSGRYWCYIEKRPGVFAKTEIDTGTPTAAGYFIKGPITPGTKLVISSAGELLARETNPSTAAD
jgi:hypothetical protein